MLSISPTASAIFPNTPSLLFIDGIAERLWWASGVRLCWPRGVSARMTQIAAGADDGLKGGRRDGSRVLLGSARQRARRPAARGQQRAPGIIRAIEECFPRSARQRCLAHRCATSRPRSRRIRGRNSRRGSLPVIKRPRARSRDDWRPASALITPMSGRARSLFRRQFRGLRRPSAAVGHVPPFRSGPSRLFCVMRSLPVAKL